MARKNDYYRQSIQHLTPSDLLPGAAQLLAELRQAGIKIAIASASRNAREVIRHLGIAAQVDAISDGHSVERQRPAPDLFLHAAAQLGVRPAECVVVDDAATGVEAAHAAGMRVIGLGSVSRVGRADALFASLEGVHLSDIFEVAP